MIEDTRYNFLIQQHKNLIYGYALYMLKDRMDADDVTQEVFIRIWQNINKFKLTSAKSWIIKTTHNLCIDLLRRRSRTNEKVFSLHIESIQNSISEDGNGSMMKRTDDKLMADQIRQKIDSLPEKLKSIFILYEIHGLKYKEISKALDMPINTVKVYLMRARKRLQKELKYYELQEVI